MPPKITNPGRLVWPTLKITKMDLASAVDFDRNTALGNIQRVRPGMCVLEVSSKHGQGMNAWLDLLETALGDRRTSGRGINPPD